MASQTFGLAGQVALVTGAGSGIGAAVVTALAREEARVVAVDSNPEALAAIKDTLGAVDLIVHRGDVRDAQSVNDAVAAAHRGFGRIDLLVNNAGVSVSAPIAELSEQQWDTVMDVNAKGTFLYTREVLPGMIARSTGAIVNISSREGKRGTPLLSAYCAAKAAVINFTRVAALEAAPNVRVNCVCPGLADTRMVQSSLEAQARALATDIQTLRHRWLDGIPLHRMQPAEAIAQAVLFLASDAASEITGQAISVDGGSVMA